MLFHVVMSVKIPHDVPPERVENLKVLEHQKASELEAQRTWVHVWRIAVKWVNISIFDVVDASELHVILSSLPLFPFMEISVIPICSMDVDKKSND